MPGQTSLGTGTAGVLVLTVEGIGHHQNFIQHFHQNFKIVIVIGWNSIAERMCVVQF